MIELLYVLVAVPVVCGLLTLVASTSEPVLRRVENGLAYLSTVLIIFAMAFICSEVVMRYVFNSPISGHLEGSELLMPIIVFFAVSYTQARHGHVGMTMVLEALPAKVSRWLSIITLVLSLLTCAILAYFGFVYTHRLWLFDDVTMSPPYFRTWPSSAAIPFGYTLLAMRMWLQVLHLLAPRRFPEPPEDDSELYKFE